MTTKPDTPCICMKCKADVRSLYHILACALPTPVRLT
jgi:hypothetical protein